MSRFSLPLDAREAETLREWAEGNGRIAERSRIVLLSAARLGADEVAHRLGVAIPTVYKWRKRFRQKGLSGLRDLPRPGQPRRLSDAGRDALVRHTTERLAPSGHWTIRSLARVLGVTEHQVREAWGAANLRPHVLRSTLVEHHPALEGQSAHAMGLYIAPPHCALALTLGPAPATTSATPQWPTPPVHEPHGSRVAPLDDALRAAFLAASPGPREELLGFLQEACTCARTLGRPLHVVLSIDVLKPREHLVLEAAGGVEPSVHTIGTNEAWLLAVNRWLKTRCGAGQALIHALHQLRGTSVVWTQSPTLAGHKSDVLPARPRLNRRSL